MYYLYVKTHNKTGLKYLGTTKNDPYVYQGSGDHWKPHIKKHGYDVTTEIVGTYNTMRALREAGLHYSKLWNVVESDKWANLVPEEGHNGTVSGKYHPMKRPEQRERQRQRMLSLGEKHPFKHLKSMKKYKYEPVFTDRLIDKINAETFRKDSHFGYSILDNNVAM